MQKLFSGGDDELSVIGRLAAGACAGMTSTLVCSSMHNLCPLPSSLKTTNSLLYGYFMLAIGNIPSRCFAVKNGC